MFAYSNLKQSFAVFRDENDLERLFTKNMDRETSLRVLSQVKELETASDWFTINKDVVNSQGSAEAAKALNIILSEYEIFLKQKIDNMIAATDAEQEQTQEKLSRQPILPVDRFAEEYSELLTTNYERLQLETSQTANDFYNRHFRKNNRNAETQSLQMHELEKVYEHEIAMLSSSLKRHEYQRDSFMSELSRMAKQMSIRENEYNEMLAKTESMKDRLLDKDAEISKQLYFERQLRQQKIEAEEKLADNNSKMMMMRLTTK